MVVYEKFDAAFFIKLLPKLLEVVPRTLGIALLAVFFGWMLGFVFALGKVSRHKVISVSVHFLTNVIRCIPTVVLLYLVYFGLPILTASFGANIGGWNKSVFVVIGLALELSASSSEMFRSAYNSLERGQLEAAHAIGMTKVQSFVRIIFPQGLYVILPNLTSATLMLVQGTSLIYTLGIMDIMGKVRQINTNTQGLKSVESYLAVILIYWAICIVLTRLFKAMEKKLSRGMRTVGSQT